MPPLQQTQVLLSPAELSYLHSSLSAQPPIRPDGRGPTQFRPVIAETDILPSANGSARVCFADGTEAIAGVKAEVEKSEWRPDISKGGEGGGDVEMGGDHDVADTGVKGAGENAWVEMTIDIPGFRDDDPLPVFLASMLTESLLCTSTLRDRLYINRRFHWRLYIDVSRDLSSPLHRSTIQRHQLCSTKCGTRRFSSCHHPLPSLCLFCL